MEGFNVNRDFEQILFSKLLTFQKSIVYLELIVIKLWSKEVAMPVAGWDSLKLRIRSDSLPHFLFELTFFVFL